MPKAIVVFMRRDSYEAMAPVKTFLSEVKANLFLSEKEKEVSSYVSLHEQAKARLQNWEEVNPLPDTDDEVACREWAKRQALEERRIASKLGLSDESKTMLHTKYSLVSTELSI